MRADRELLVLAAKAAGMIIRDSNRWPNTVIRQVEIDDGSTNWIRWNPLTDAGDALRLAVKRGYAVVYYRNAPPELGLPRECAVVTSEDGRWVAEAPRNGDEIDATCRAIVRLAAEDGLSIP